MSSQLRSASGKRRDFFLAHHGAEHRRLRVEQRRDPFDEHAFADAADRQRHVELRALTDLEPDGLRDCLKARGGNLDEPLAGAEPGDLIHAGVSRFHLALRAAGDGRQLDERARHDGARAVVHDARKCRAIDLRAAGRRKHKKDYDRMNESNRNVMSIPPYSRGNPRQPAQRRRNGSDSAG